VEERVFILESYLKTMSYVHCRQSFLKNLEGKCQYKILLRKWWKNSVQQVHFWTRIVIGSRSQC